MCCDGGKYPAGCIIPGCGEKYVGGKEVYDGWTVGVT